MKIPTPEFTPWNPSRKDIKRVLNPLPIPSACPYCQGEVQIQHHKDIYGRVYNDWPWVYSCPDCQATVGMHPFTNIPLGTIANRQLRGARTRCKPPFEKLWRGGPLTRTEAYQALAKHLGIPFDQCHFGWFDRETCERAYQWAINYEANK